MFSADIIQAVRLLTERCVERNVKVVFAESCTAGLIAAAMTALPGSSRVVDRGFVVYSNESKSMELEVPSDLIDRHGAVSKEGAIAMAKGALARTQGMAELSISVTGVAGPEETDSKPAGLVHIAVALDDCVDHEEHRFGALGRDRVREQTVLAALALAARCVDRSDLRRHSP